VVPWERVSRCCTPGEGDRRALRGRSGDATLAGFAYAFAEGMNAEQTLRRAAACGAANCLPIRRPHPFAGRAQDREDSSR